MPPAAAYKYSDACISISSRVVIDEEGALADLYFVFCDILREKMPAMTRRKTAGPGSSKEVATKKTALTVPQAEAMVVEAEEDVMQAEENGE